MAKESPLQAVKRLYGSKDKLIEKVADVAREAGEDAAEVKERLVSVSNKKLLRLAEVGRTVKEQYGSKDKLIDALTRSLGKAKDKDYIARLRSLSTASLLDRMKSASRRVRRAGKKAASA